MNNSKKKSSDNRLIELGIKLKKVISIFFYKYKYLMLMNVVIFILTVFIESLYFSRFNFFEFLNAIIFIVITTIIFTKKYKIKSKDIVLSIPMLYILFLIFLNYCTIRELYGISKLGLDKIPNYIDALMVVFVFTCFEYITAVIINKKKKIVKKA